MAKKHLVDCSVQCDGRRYDFNVWPRHGEGDLAACLRKASRIAPGVPCESLRVRQIGRLSKAGTRYTLPFRKHDLGRPPRVKIVRED